MADRTSAIVPLDALAQIEDGLDVHRWIKLWEADGRKIDTTIAIAFYHQALQDAMAVLRPTSTLVPHHGSTTSVVKDSLTTADTKETP